MTKSTGKCAKRRDPADRVSEIERESGCKFIRLPRNLMFKSLLRFKCGECGTVDVKKLKLLDTSGGYCRECAQVRGKAKRQPVDRPMAFNMPECREKREQVMLERYGAKNPSHVPELCEKREKVLLERTGYRYPNQSPAAQAKKERTMIARYGVIKAKKQ